MTYDTESIMQKIRYENKYLIYFCIFWTPMFVCMSKKVHVPMFEHDFVSVDNIVLSKHNKWISNKKSVKKVSNEIVMTKGSLIDVK